MRTVYIKFQTEADRAKGFYELATRSQIASLPGAVYHISLDALKLLDQQQINYRRATDDEVKAAHDQVRNPSPVVL